MFGRAKITAKRPEAKRENSVFRAQKAAYSQSINSPVDHILFLQRTIGNQAVQRLFKSGALQAKLRIGQPGDIYEKEADRIAGQVIQMPDLGTTEKTAVFGKTWVPHIQRICTECEGELYRKPMKGKEGTLQTKGTSGQTPEVTLDVQTRIEAMRGGGEPLPKSIRAFFEPRFGYDFNQVRVHTDSQAAESARTVSARAFTVGRDVVFAAGQYVPGSAEGKRLLAHELTHVVQQEGSILIQKKGKGKKKGEDKKPLASAPKEITDDLKQKMAATVLAEAFEGQEYDIAWIYYNHVISKGEEGLNVSSAFKGKGDWFKVWMVALADTTYAKDKPRPQTPDVSEYDAIEDYVKKHEWFKINGPPRVDKVKELIGTICKDPSKNPYKGWRGQGSLDDFNRDDGQWILARQYFYLQEEEKVTDIYVKKLPADKKEYTSFIFHREEINKYFNRNPEMLKKPLKKYTP